MGLKYFGTDGIRGRTNTAAMSAELALRVGIAAGRTFAKGQPDKRVIIGKDTRLSGYMIEAALVSGFTSVGMNVFQIGPLPTPAVAMLTQSMRAELGVMISASYNPYDDNGIKLFGPDGHKLSDAVEAEIEKAIASDMSGDLVSPSAIGRAHRVEGASARYVEYAKRTWPSALSLNGMRIVVDCAHGAAYKVAPEALWELGAEVITIGVEPNGTNINERCGSTVPERIAEKVIELRADVGLAFDGDADRLIIVDEKGNIVDGDQLIATISQAWARKQRIRGGGVAATIMSNLALERYLGSIKLEMVRTRVGDRHVVNEMIRRGFNVGGEQSGHLVLSDFATTGDGLISALQILAEIVERDCPASEVLNCFEPLPQITRSVPFDTKSPLLADSVTTAIAAAERRISKTGRLVVRSSGTESVVRIMAEADNQDLITEVVDNLTDAMLHAA